MALLKAQAPEKPPVREGAEESTLASESLELGWPGPEGDLLFEPGELSLSSHGQAHALASPRWRVAPHLYLRATYDDNIYIQPRDRKEDLILTAAPGIALGWWSDAVTIENYTERRGRASRLETAAGNFFYFDYTAVGRAFLEQSEESSLGHEALLSGAWYGAKSRLGTEFQYSKGTVADEDIGTLVERELSSGILDARWDLSSKTAFNSAVKVSHAEYEAFYKETEWRFENSMSWAYSPLLGFEPGFALGYLDAGSKDEQEYTQLLLRGYYRPTSKLSWDGVAGVEFRHSENFSDHTTPVGRLRAVYELEKKKRLTLEGYQEVRSSAQESLGTYRSTGFSLGLEQDLRGGLLLALASGYDWVRYDKAEAESRRQDGYYFINARLIYNLNRWWNVGLLLQHRRNDSSLGSYDYRSNQVALEASLLY